MEKNCLLSCLKDKKLIIFKTKIIKNLFIPLERDICPKPAKDKTHGIPRKKEAIVAKKFVFKVCE